MEKPWRNRGETVDRRENKSGQKVGFWSNIFGLGQFLKKFVRKFAMKSGLLVRKSGLLVTFKIKVGTRFPLWYKGFLDFWPLSHFFL